MSVITAQLIHALAGLILGSDIFTRVLAVVERWEEKTISGLEKKTGVLAELEIIGLKLLEWEANLAVELAVAFVKNKAS